MSTSAFHVDSLTPVTPPRRSCEYCFKVKGKCSFNPGASSCARCLALSKPCKSRPTKRKGRTPKLVRYPQGQILVFPLDEEKRKKKKKPLEGKAPRALKVLCKVPHNDSEGDDDDDSPLPPLPSPLSSTINYSSVTYAMGTSDGFFATHRPFILGASFTAPFHRAVKSLYTHDPHAIGSAYAAVLSFIGSQDNFFRSPPPSPDFDFTPGLRCLEHLLRRNRPGTPRDAAVLLWVGQLLLIYNSLIPTAATVYGRAITQGMLLNVKEWSPALLRHPGFHPVVVSPVWIDVVECVLRRETPLAGIEHLDCRLVVDKLLGLCVGLLPLFYELCERSFQAKIQDRADGAGQSRSGSPDDDLYSDLEQKFLIWSPKISRHTLSRHFEPMEITLMMVQAECYKLAGLLIIRRLQVPLRVYDAQAVRHAERIFEQLSVLKTRSPDEPTGFGLDLPLLLAALELPGPGEEMVEAFRLLRFCQGHADEVLRFIRSVWRKYDDGYDGLWLDLVNDLPNVPFP